MTIEFTCKGCEYPLRAPGELAGRSIRCPHCKAVQVVPDAAKAKARAAAEAKGGVAPVAKPNPAAPAAGPAPGIDWNLMAEAVKDTVDVTDSDVQADPDAVDWNAIAGTAPSGKAARMAPDGRAGNPGAGIYAPGSHAPGSHAPGSSALGGHAGHAGRAHADEDASPEAVAKAKAKAQALRDGLVYDGVRVGGKGNIAAFLSNFEEIPAVEEPKAKTRGGQFDEFLTESLMAIPYAGNYLLQVLLVVLIVFGMGLVMPILAMGGASLLESMPHREVAIAMAVILLIPQLVCLGFLSQVWLEITHSTADESQAFIVPDFSIATALHALLMFALFVLVYVAPVVTLPLAPMAFLVLSRTHDTRAFDMGYIGKLTVQHAAHVAIVLAISALAAVACFFIGAGLFPVIAGFSLSMIEGMSIEACDFIAAQATFFLVSPLMILAASGAARLAGLLGKHNPHIYQFMPVRRHVTVSLGYGVAAAVAAVLVMPALLLSEPVTEGVQSRFLASRVLDLEERKRQKIEGTNPAVAVNPQQNPNTRPGTQVNPYSGIYQPNVYVEVPVQDLSKLTPDEQLAYHMQQLRSADPVRQHQALTFLAAATPGERRGDVLLGLEQYIAQTQNPVLVTTALAAHQAWNDDPLRGAIVRFSSRDREQKLAAAKELAALPVVEEKRGQVLVMLDEAMRLETDAGVMAALVGVVLAWHPDPLGRLSLELDAQRPGSGAVIAALGIPDNEKAAPILTPRLGSRSQQRDAAAAALMKIGPAAEPAVLSVLTTNTDATARLMAVTILETIGTARSVEPLKAVTRESFNQQLVLAAQAALRKIAPEGYSEVAEALAAIERATPKGHSINLPLLTLKNAKPTDTDRPAVIAAMAAVMEGGFRADPQVFEVLATWADNETVPMLIKMLDGKGVTDARLRSNLFNALAKSKNPKAVVPIAKWMAKDPYSASQALIEIGQPAEDHMLRMLRESDDNTKLHVIRVLEKIGGPNSLTPLINLAKNKVNYTLKNAAANAVLTIQSRMKSQP